MKKNNFIIVALIAVIFSSCSTYHITVMDDSGSIIKEHDTKNMYVGTGAFVPDAVLDPLVMVSSLFLPIPYLKSNINVNGGMDLPSYIGKMSSLAPSPLVGNGGSGDWIKFHDDKGNIISYNGFNYSIVRKSAYDKPER